MTRFPPFVAISANVNSTKLFMTQVNKGDRTGFLEFSSAEEVPSLKAKFAVESAEDDRFVHIKCCSSNKYWCR